MVYEERFSDGAVHTTSASEQPADQNAAYLTRNEQVVLAELEKWQTPAKAYDLLEKLIDKGLRSPMTIYRALDSLICKGLAKKVATLNAYVAVPENRGEGVLCFPYLQDLQGHSQGRVKPELYQGHIWRCLPDSGRCFYRGAWRMPFLPVR